MNYILSFQMGESDALATLASAALGCDQATTNGTKQEVTISSNLAWLINKSTLV